MRLEPEDWRVALLSVFDVDSEDVEPDENLENDRDQIGPLHGRSNQLRALVTHEGVHCVSREFIGSQLRLMIEDLGGNDQFVWSRPIDEGSQLASNMSGTSGPSSD
jgi:hypothetical protein